MTESNKVYELGEEFNRQDMVQNGFSDGATQHFERGFPSNWRELLGAQGCWSAPAETTAARQVATAAQQVLRLPNYGLGMDAAV